MIARRPSRLPGSFASACKAARVVALALVLVLGPSAFSAAQTPPASNARGAVPQLPASGESPGAAYPLPVPPSATTPPSLPPPREIALVLPLTSAIYGRAAEAVKAGFEAAAELAHVKPLVIAHGDSEVVAAMTRARDAGAVVIVGPLVRDDLKAVATADVPLPWIVALNQLDDGAPLPYHMYALTLTVESDGRQLARYLRRDDTHNVAVIVGDSPLQKRLAAAFVEQWLELGGGPPSIERLDRDPPALVRLKQRMAKTPPDAVLLATDVADAALARPYLGTLPVCTGSQIDDRQPPQLLRDLADVCFIEIPWLAEPDAPAFAKLKHPSLGNAALDRLYALGIDAFRVAQAIQDGPIDRLEFDGATGHLTLDDSHVFAREGRVLRYSGSAIEPSEAR